MADSSDYTSTTEAPVESYTSSTEAPASSHDEREAAVSLNIVFLVVENQLLKYANRSQHANKQPTLVKPSTPKSKPAMLNAKATSTLVTQT
jgi:hypothetical protein